jgi:CheY-like chemotaxis protein
MDCQMPEMDGCEATRRIRLRESANSLGESARSLQESANSWMKRRTPIIAFTASWTEEARERCANAGMDDFLAKPVSRQALHRMLERWLPRSGDLPANAAPPDAAQVAAIQDGAAQGNAAQGGNDQGRGSTSVNNLQSACGSAVRPLSVEGAAAQPLRILIAEDVPENQMLLTAYLEKEGYELTFVEDGKSAHTLAAQRDFDLVLMDMHMPVMDGLEATAAIREHEKLSGCLPVPVIALTADVDADEIARGRAAGCDAHLAKPVSRKELLRSIADLGYRKRHAAAQLEGIAENVDTPGEDEVVATLAHQD